MKLFLPIESEHQMERKKTRLTTRQFEDVAKQLQKFHDASPNIFDKKLADATLPAFNKASSEISVGRELPFFRQRYLNEFEAICERIALEQMDRDQLFWIAFNTYVVLREQIYYDGTFDKIDEGFFSFFEENSSSFTPSEKIRLDYLRYSLQRDLLQSTVRAMRSELAIEGKALLDQLAPKAETIANWDASIGALEKRVNDQRKFLQQQLETLNFVGLSKAFVDQITRVNAYKSKQVTYLELVGGLLVITPLLPTILAASGWIDLSFFPAAILTLAPFLVIEIILFYFFRIFLRNYYSSAAQLLQFSLRNSLCAFVESYSEFVGKLRTVSDQKVLDKFESLIFSGVSPDPSNIPSHFDGMDQITNFIRELRGKP